MYFVGRLSVNQWARTGPWGDQQGIKGIISLSPFLLLFALIFSKKLPTLIISGPYSDQCAQRPQSTVRAHELRFFVRPKAGFSFKKRCFSLIISLGVLPCKRGFRWILLSFFGFFVKIFAKLATLCSNKKKPFDFRFPTKRFVL